MRSDSIGIFIPCFNARNWAQQLTLIPGVNYYASDSGSTDGTPEILEAKGVIVIRQTDGPDRIENWKRVIAYFLETEHGWMKWLFSGDVILPSGFKAMEQATKSEGARMVVAPYYFIDTDGSRIRSSDFTENRNQGAQTIYPDRSAALIAKYGNWMGPPLAVCVHRNVAAQSRWSDSSWTADMELFSGWALGGPVHVISEPIGEFHVSERRLFVKERNSLKSTADDFLARLRVLDSWPDSFRSDAEREFSLQVIRSQWDRLPLEEISRLVSKQSLVRLLRLKLMRFISKT